MNDKRIAVQILYFDCEQFILRTIDNCGPFVEKIYIVYSELPYASYNANARKLYRNPSSLEVLKQSPYFDKIEIVEGVWDNEQDQRNQCLLKAKEDGFDFLIIQDADEFYLPEEYQKNIDGMLSNPNYYYYRNPWYFFWKTTNYILESWHPLAYKSWKLLDPYSTTTIGYNTCFAINCKMDVRFENRRMPDKINECLMLNGICHHLSFVMSDEQMRRKLDVWSHSNQAVHLEKWYKVKWKGWKPGTKNLHLISVLEFPAAKKYEGKIPKEIESFDPGTQVYIKPQVKDKLYFDFLENWKKFKYFLLDIRFVFKGYSRR
jgi:hypothetical protein